MQEKNGMEKNEEKKNLVAVTSKFIQREWALYRQLIHYERTTKNKH